jgi:hypothetical protein
MKKLIATICALGAVAAVAPATSVAATRQFEGTVVSVNRSDHTFRLRDSERGTVRIRVTGSTRFARISGFSGLRKGMTRIEATVRRSNGLWVATSSSAPAAPGTRAAAAVGTAISS